MADLAASIAKARKAGYSDAEISAYIAKDPKFGPKVQAARKAGFNDAQIVGHLGKVSGVKDTFKSYASGLMEGAAGLADTVLQASPVGVFDATLKTAAGVAGRLSGKGDAKMANPFSGSSQQASRQSYKPQTTAGEYARTVGQMTPNALAPGSAGARVANVFAPAIASETAGQVARASGAGPTGEAVARGVGALGGAGVASLRPQNIFAGERAAPVVRVARQTRQDPNAMRQRAQEFRDAGIQPTLTDVVDDAGRGLVKAAANRQTPGRQVANDFARNRANDLPSRMSEQARRNMSRDPRTPDQIREAMTARRTTNANQAFGAVRGDVVEMAPETVQALRNPMGKDAIAEAARRERDPQVRAALNRLANDALDAPSTPISVGMADRISRTLFGKGQAAARAGDNDLAATYNSLGEAVRGPVRQGSEGYRQALEGFGADSRLMESAKVGEGLLQRNTDEFARAAGGLQPQERVLALAAGRRAVERSAGESVGAAPGVARRLANAPEQQARNTALMGPERAQRFQSGMRAEVQAVDNANMIAPGRGSPTFLNQADDQKIDAVQRVGGRIFRGDFVGAAWTGARDWLRTRGLNDEQAEALVRLATDPAQTDQVMQLLTQRLGPQQAQEFLQLRNAAMVGATGMATGGFRSTNEERR